MRLFITNLCVPNNFLKINTNNSCSINSLELIIQRKPFPQVLTLDDSNHRNLFKETELFNKKLKILNKKNPL
jgi:hypothetical protein